MNTSVVEVVVLDKSTKRLVQKGIVVTVPETYLPIKIYSGHVIILIEKDVDYIFCPRFVHAEKGFWFCPKYIGLPELIEKIIPDTKLLVAEIDCKRNVAADIKCFMPVAKTLRISKSEMKKALRAAAEDFEKFCSLCRSCTQLYQQFKPW